MDLEGLVAKGTDDDTELTDHLSRPLTSFGCGQPLQRLVVGLDWST
jgi:hypothetical protein